MTLRQSLDHTRFVPVFILELYRVLHIHCLIFLCSLSVKFPWEIAAVCYAHSEQDFPFSKSQVDYQETGTPEEVNFVVLPLGPS